MATSDEASATIFYKGLSEWWSEETEYVFQRIERWAAFARGYNRLRSQRVSKGRMTMQDGQESRWNISSNKLVIEEPSWSPHFHTLRRGRRRSRPEEEIRINRYTGGVLGYRSNGNLDSTCLENYRYDHSIYFKTIGEIRNGKRNHSEEKSYRSEGKGSIDGEEEEEMEDEEEDTEERSSTTSDCFLNEIYSEEPNRPISSEKNGSSDSLNYFFEEMCRSSKNNANEVAHNVWPIVDLAKLDLSCKNPSRDRSSQETNNNVMTSVISAKGSFDEKKSKNRSEFQMALQKDQDAMEKTLDTKRSTKYRRSSKTTIRPIASADSNVLWPGIYLNCNKNSDPYLSVPPYHCCTINMK